VEGSDTLRFLNDLLSQELTMVQATIAIRSFLLAPQGKLRALLWVFGSDERIGLIADAGIGNRVADDLTHYKIRIKATIHRPVPVTTVVGSLPPGAIVASFGETEVGFLTEELDARALTSAEWDAIRLEAAEPVMDVDIDEKTIPQETGLVEAAVSFEKGCYLGQELVARIDTRGHVNRRLRRVSLEGPVAVPAEVRVGQDAVGSITSTSYSPTRHTHLGLGLLHRSVSPGDPILVGAVDGVVDN
jgi:folate-binding protein YgfZ